MADRPSMPDSHVVRRMMSGMTHVALVEEVGPATMFGAAYWHPQDVRAACGVRITDGVVMQPGTKTKCVPCKHITGITEEPPR